MECRFAALPMAYALNGAAIAFLTNPQEARANKL